MSADLLVSPVLRCFFSGFPPSVKSTPTVHLKAVIHGQLLQYMAAAEGAFNMPSASADNIDLGQAIILDIMLSLIQ